MSLRAYNYAKELPVKPAAKKLVLLVVADYSTDGGLSYPTMKTFVRDTGLDKAAILANLSNLQSDGIIEDTKKRVGENGDIIVWKLNPIKAIEQKPKTPRAPRTKTPDELLEAEKIYKIYFRPVNPKKSLPLIDACIKRYGFQIVFDNTKRFSEAYKASGESVKHCPHSETYFRNDRFMDDPATWGFKVATSPRAPLIIAHAPKMTELMSYAQEKTTDKNEAARWTQAFGFHWNQRKWMKAGKLLEWKVEFSAYIENQRAVAARPLQFSKHNLSAGADEENQTQ